MDFAEEAKQLAKVIRKEFGLEVALLDAERGKFDVFLNDKHLIGRPGRMFASVPSPDDVLDALRRNNI